MALMICGVPRSGTTLLRRICNEHPDIAVTYETRVFAFPVKPLFVHARNISINLTRRSIAGWRSGRPDLLWQRARFLTRYLAALGTARPALVDAKAREDAMHRVFPHARVVGDKYPGYVFDLDTFAHEEQLSCLVIYRDGRDVASSTLKAARTAWKGRHFVRNVDSADKVAARWVFGIEKMLAHQTQVHVVRYEELVTDPRAVMTGIGEWLGVDPDGFPTQDVRGTSVGNYRDGLTDEELDTVNTVAGGTLTKLGYR